MSMLEECFPIYGQRDSAPNSYAVTSTQIVFALPIAAGLALLAKRLKGLATSRIAIGIISAALWTMLLAAHWATPQFSRQALPRELSSLVFILLFSGTLLDWMIAAFRSRLRPFLNDAIVIALISALLVTLSAASSAITKVCEVSSDNPG
ncbi:hypothetical protein [Leisingera sp. S232]|uniref:hypothetical protein n=1 Tax=Leisingera sp. S232 TaxID=3415132 RepID=UPI003C7E3095